MLAAGGRASNSISNVEGPYEDMRHGEKASFGPEDSCDNAERRRPTHRPRNIPSPVSHFLAPVSQNTPVACALRLLNLPPQMHHGSASTGGSHCCPQHSSPPGPSIDAPLQPGTSLAKGGERWFPQVFSIQSFKSDASCASSLESSSERARSAGAPGDETPGSRQCSRSSASTMRRSSRDARPMRSCAPCATARSGDDRW